MAEEGLLIVFVGMALVTYIPRLLPVLAISRIELPGVVRRWLEFIPASILAALLVPMLLAPEGSLELSPDNGFLLAALPTFAVGIKTRSLVQTVTAGILFIYLLRRFL